MLNNIGLPGLLLIAVVVLALFGRGKVSSLMGEVGKGISSFKKGVREGSEDISDAGRELTSEMKAEEASRDEKLRDVTPDDQKQV
ncbi:MAG: twin-arginine translocase TatA/TatE family subunit [Paracoccus sp. (in: a-proteobacteria)]